MSRALLEKFKHLVDPPPPPTVEIDQGELDREQREELEDLTRCVGSRSFMQLRGYIVSEIQGCQPDPMGGMESAAATSFLRAGLERALSRIDTMVAKVKGSENE